LEFRAHVETLELLRRGVFELRSCPGVGDALPLQAFLDKFLVTKIGNRVLVDNYVNWVDRVTNGDRSLAPPGVVTECRLSPLLREVAEVVRGLAQDVYGRSPEVLIDDALDTEVFIIPSHLDFIFKEMLKNAVCATLERHASQEWRLPPVHVAIHPGRYDVEVRVADQGGGMRRHMLKRIWEYGFSGCKVERMDGIARSFDPVGRHMAISGYGVGVPLSRLFARYFGGDLLISSVYGFGTDVSIRLNRLGDHVELGCSAQDDESAEGEDKEAEA